MKLLSGCEVPNRVLLLQSFVYTLMQNLLNFYEHLRQGLETRGFTKSDHDVCLFTDKKLMVLFWLDDCIIYVKEASDIDKVIDSLKDSFLLEQEDNMVRFLSLKIE